MEKEIALVYMVAGLSNRFLGRIKQFAEVGPEGETLIEYSLKQALPADFSKIIFIVGNKTEKPFMEKFGNSYMGIPIYYALQLYDEKTRDKPWGTTDALCSAKPLLNCPFVVCNGDDLYGEKSFKILTEHLSKHNNSAAIGFRLESVLPQDGKVNRGVFQHNNGKITSLREIIGIGRSDIWEGIFGRDTLCSMNIFALQPEVLNHLSVLLEQFKEKNKEDRKKESFLPEDISTIIKQEKISMNLYSTPDSWMGITNPGDDEIIRRKLSKAMNIK
jgi:NDP-sugar pyrophosphorylase family protein